MSEPRDADRPPLEFWFRTLCDARAVGNFDAGFMRCAEELYRAALTAQRGWDAAEADDRDLHAEAERLREELSRERELRQAHVAVAIGEVQRLKEELKVWESLASYHQEQQEIAEAGRAAAQAEVDVVRAERDLELRTRVAAQSRVTEAVEAARVMSTRIDAITDEGADWEERALRAQAEMARLREAVKMVSREWDQTAGLQHQSPRLWEAFDRLVALASDPARGKDDAP